MNIDTQDVQKRALALLQGGKNTFNAAKTKEQRTEGYKQFIEGVELLVNLSRYMKDNPSAVEILKKKIKEYMDEAKRMKEMCGTDPGPDLSASSGNSGTGKNSNPGAGDDKDGKKGSGDKDNDKFRDALSQAIVKEKPNVKWEDVAGLEQAKKTLQEAIILPVKFPDIFVGIRKPWKGILLYGPPGTGKTFLAKACATQANATFFAISSSDLISKWVGESEKLIKQLFKLAQENEVALLLHSLLLFSLMKSILWCLLDLTVKTKPAEE
jgi:vacuolar protein-sorting-associated protein 4